MSQESENSKDNFLYPLGQYHGEFSPTNLALNANLQEFAQKVSYICGLENNGKISTEEAYDRIRELWCQLHHSKQQLQNNTDSEEES